MGIVGTLMEVVFALPVYLYALVVSGWTSLSLVKEFLALVINGNRTAIITGTSGLGSLSKTIPAFSFNPAPRSYWLAMAGVVLFHYAAYSLLAKIRSPSVRANTDRVVWACLSCGLAIGWTHVFWNVLPMGSLSLVSLGGGGGGGGGESAAAAANNLIISVRGEALINFFLPYFMYSLLTGVSSDSRPGGFFMRKLVPVLAVIVLLVNKGKVTPRIIGWLLRCLMADALTDFIIAWRVRLSFICLIVWTLVVGGMFSEYHLYASDALGLFPCIILAVMALWAYIFQIKAEVSD
jgi:hypothetical protein